MLELPEEAVENIGGVKESGPWPTDADKISVGNTYKRPVPSDNPESTTTTANVTVNSIKEIIDEDGNSSGGRIVSFTHGGSE
jgi:hypothetical protein